MLDSEAWYVRSARLVLGALGLVAVGTQFFHEIGLGQLRPVNFFSYFTVLSNIGAGSLLVVLASVPGVFRPVTAVWLRGAMAVYMATTGIVYALLLSDEPLGITLPWVNAVTHQIMPIVLVVDWLVVRPRRQLGYLPALAWLVFPLGYLAYSMIRGAVIDWYPYPFLRPDEAGGVTGMSIHIVGIVLGVVVASLIVAWLGNARQTRPELSTAA